jgi:hypothetical protein
MTSTVGSITPADVIGVTGVSTTSAVGDLTVGTIELINVTGVSTTSSVGSVISEIKIPLSGVSATSAVGSIPSLVPMTVGLTGQLATASVNGTGLSFPGTYEILTPKTSTGYTTQSPKTSTGYTIKTPA